METPREKLKRLEAAWRKGGKANVSKGFANPDVMAKAIKTRALRAAQKKLQNSENSS